MITERFRPLVYLLVSMACVFIIIWGIRGTAYIINPLLLAFIITLTLLPLPEKLKQRGLPGWLALVLTILAVVAALAVVILLVVVSIGQLSAQIPTYAAQIEARQAELAATQVSEEAPSTPQDIVQAALAQLQGLLTAQQLNDTSQSVVRAVAESVAMVFLTLLIFAFMMSAAITLPGAARLGLDPGSDMVRRVAEYTKDVRQYMVTMTIINFLVGLGDTILLYIIGVDFAILWGILAWILGYIPSVGFWLALIPPVLMAWAQYGLQTALLVFIMYVLINGGVQNIVQPKMMGDSLRISPVVVFVSFFIWGWLLGGIGAILAVPLTMVILSVLDSFESTRWLAILLRLTPERETREKQEAEDRLKATWGSLQDLLRRDKGS